MGVLNNKRKVFFKSPISGGDSSGLSEDEGILNEVEAVPPRPQRPPRPPPSPASTRKLPLAGTCLKLKKGRRARHRYDSERSLFAAVDMDPDEAPEGWDIAQENNSHFRALLDQDNRHLLDRFLDNESIDSHDDNEAFTANENEICNDNDPEASFLRISSHLRQALKKHLPWGILENLQEKIIEHFVNNPEKCYVATDFSSYERLLAHVCSMYNRLESRSFDNNGIRTLKISNPSGSNFEPIDPNLVAYLKMRSDFCNKI